MKTYDTPISTQLYFDLWGSYSIMNLVVKVVIMVNLFDISMLAQSLWTCQGDSITILLNLLLCLSPALRHPLV